MPQGFVSINPATEERIAEYASFSPEDVCQRLLAARAAFADWSARTISDRAVFFSRLRDRLLAGKDDLSRLITLEMGKPLAQSRAEIEKCAALCDYYLAHAERFLSSQQVSGNTARESLVRFDPLGVVLAVMPWNFPFWQVFRFAVPGLLAGNTGLLKHASNVTGCALAIDSLFRESGFPEGVFAALLVNREQIAGLIGSDEISAVTLTGSELAGKQVAEAAGRHLKKAVLELGGSDPFIVLPDADVGFAAQQGVLSRTIGNGQSCIAAKRFLVHEDLADQFLSAFVSGMEALRVGDPLDPETRLGPLAREDLRESLDVQVRKTVKAGAGLLTGGKAVAGCGWYYAPTVLAGVTPGMAAFDEETFGPVAAVATFRTIDEAIALANQSPFGLGASLWTADRERAAALAARLQAGCVFINDFVKSDPSVPFGGVKNSGFGRELGEFGIREFVNIKTVWTG